MSDLVTVNLNRKRPYRARHSDRKAIWVGPGRAEVPAWVAEAWGIEAEVAPKAAQSAADAPIREPWPAYDEMNVGEIVMRLPELSQTERAIVRAYESRNKARKGVLEAVAEWL